jgi:4-hydroxy-2-oxoheptanedioate aldolase
VEGIDVFFVGPGDLSNSMGKARGPIRDPEVLQIVDRTLARIIAADRVAGTTVQIANTPAVRSKQVLYLYQHLNALMAPGLEQYVKEATG